MSLLFDSMPHRKIEETFHDHEIVVQQVNKDGDVSAWIDGYAVYVNKAIEACGDMIVGKLINKRMNDGEEWEAIKSLTAMMAHLDVYFCKKCNNFYDADNVVQTNFAGHKCSDCANEDEYCPDNDENNKHVFKTTNPRYRNNARVATKYKCEHCGYKKQDTPTG